MNQHLYNMVVDWIPRHSRVLDLGTGDGEFLERLNREKQTRGEGVEKDPEMAARCVERGLIVHHGDILDGLDQYPDDAFDCICILGTFQELLSPQQVLAESFRVSANVVVGYHNCAFWQARLQLGLNGRSPRLGRAAEPWYQSPNVQFFSVEDFEDFAETSGMRLIQSGYFNARGSLRWRPNLRASEALAWIQRAGQGGNGK
ncbi:MAG: methionine biosynthesis protein MetW [Leptospirales bacterium]|nr:methionine biosynthesis protein MetW [Leptospirales bacterium]